MVILMFKEFSHRHSDCTVDGSPGKVILSRDSKSTSIISREYLYNAVFSPVSAVTRGSIIKTADTFFVQTLRLTTSEDKYCSLIKTNIEAELQRYSNIYGENKNIIDRAFTPVQTGIPAFAQHVTARMRMEDMGLLPTTSYVLIIPVTVDVKTPQEAETTSLDRILLGGVAYQVNDVNRVKYPNLLQLQLSEDVR
ncbi:hypothetical protein [Paenibacillus radicis (ex Xue et al. 2023)]|uniref:Uncharacterized protein n=1 Tax=Paenibacillus radicis (ex Xue et al. 2023) TaxID=2972489 RepID=A0ABT1YJZ5_9BACL|nr:hypothetical protein [Paenibacillus radicis (ex Xue et al. 2023)]MCR8633489.1 hypothetical protein [Paenibacillus radicis (ex Xue et al. 2023)]